MDVNTAVNDLSGLVEAVTTIDIDHIDPRNYSLQESRLLSWFIAYFSIKFVFRMLYGGKIWEETALLHNFISVIVGLYDVYFWNLSESSTCLSLNSRSSLTIGIQLIHCLTDVVFAKEMYQQPVFFWHHFVLCITSLVFPYCPGCYYVVIAYTCAEAGSMSIAIDFWWRQAGGNSRGFKRVLIFGLTRVLNLFLLYRIWLVTPSTTYFTLSSEGNEVLTVNFPICMITSIGGSFMMLLVNGLTWYRMFIVYRKNLKKRRRSKKNKKKQ